MLDPATRDSRIALILFLIVSAAYFATITGVTSSNDGSHYALVRAIVDRGSFEISPYLDFTENQDFAMRGDLRFSDRPPGTALVAAPLYALSSIAPPPLVPLPSKHDPENPRLLYAVLAAPLAASAAVVIFYWAMRRHLGRSPTAALFASLALAFGTTTWKYGSILYSHSVAALVVWLSIYLTLSLCSKDGVFSWPLAFGVGFLLGFAILVEYTNVVFTAMAGLYILWYLARRQSAGRMDARWRAKLIPLALGGLIPVGFLLIYNTVNFGGPFEVSTFSADTTIWPQNEGLAADFATPLRVGLPAMLWYGSNNQGLFLLAPITLLSLPGLIAFYRHSRSRFVFLMGLFVAMLVLFSKSTTFNPLTNDGRYLTPFLGLWLIPLAFWIDHQYLKPRAELVRIALSFLLFGLFFLSIRNQFLHIAFSWNYDLDLGQLRPLATPPDNLRLLFSTVFPNAGNLPLLWLGEGLGLGVAALIRNWRASLAAARASPLPPGSTPAASPASPGTFPT
jgi:hypothetical protein